MLYKEHSAVQNVSVLWTGRIAVTNFDPKRFDPEVLAESLETEVKRIFEDSCVPVNLMTQIDYDVHDGDLIRSAGSFTWTFADLAPFYMRLRQYLTHWLYHIEAEIVKVQIGSDQFDEVIVAGSGLENWMSNGGPPLVN